MRRFIGYAALLLAMPVGAETAPDDRGMLQCPPPENDAVSFALVSRGGDAPIVPMTVPRAYLASDVQSGSERDSLLLYLNVETWGPWDDAVLPHPKYGPFGTLLVTQFRPLEEGLVGLVSHPLNMGQSFRDVLDVAPGPYGLLEVSYDALGHVPLNDDSHYVAVDAGDALTDRIQCDPTSQEPTRFGMCNHRIEAGVWDFKINYAFERLPQWRSLRDAAIGLFECFSMSSL